MKAGYNAYQKTRYENAALQILCAIIPKSGKSGKIDIEIAFQYADEFFKQLAVKVKQRAVHSTIKKRAYKRTSQEL